MTRARTRPPGVRALGSFLPAAGLLGMAACDLPTAPPRFQPTFVVETEAVTVPVTSAPAASFVVRQLADLDGDVVSRARGGALLIGVDNGSNATGVARVRIDGGGALAEGTVAIDEGVPGRIDIPEAAMRAFLGQSVMIRVSGTLCPAEGCGVRPPPFPTVTFRPRIEVTFEIGGEG